MKETLDQLCNRHTADKGSLWHDFCRRYDPYLAPLRDKPINLLEVGIQFGCSARMWLDYFSCAQIYGVDIRKEHHVDDDDIRFHFQIGDQSNVDFWSQWKSQNPRMHVIIDDAAHVVPASRPMFESLWPHLEPGGLYAIEDVCCWWDSDYHTSADQGDWLKSLIGSLNWFGKDYGGKPKPYSAYALSGFERTVDSIHCSKHLVLIVKK